MSYSEMMKEAMDKLGLTQSDVARTANIPRSTLNKYLSGIRKPNIKCARMIAEVLKLDRIEFEDAIADT